MNYRKINICIVSYLLIISVLIILVNNKSVSFSWRDASLLIMFFVFLHSFAINKLLLKKYSDNYYSPENVEKEIAKLKEKIIIQNAQLSSILNNMPFIVYLKDSQGRFIVGNRKLENLLNKKNIEFVGHKSDEICLKAFANDVKTEDNRVLNDKETIIVELKNDLLNKEGDWYRIIKSPILAPNNKVIGMIVIVNDINKEKELELQRETFVATLTHDLKTPTNAQLTAMNLLLNESLGFLNEDQKDIVLQTKNSNVYMANMISTILDVYKSESSETRLVIEKFDFCEFINEACKELSRLAETKHQKIVLKFDIKDSWINGDKLQLKRAVTNLIANAIIHGFESTEVIVEVKEKSNNIVFNVKNKSKYIEKERLAEVFEKYKSIKHAKSNKASTGLGLYLSRKIIKMHKGEIYAKSWEDNTCLFGFFVPKDIKMFVKQKS